MCSPISHCRSKPNNMCARIFFITLELFSDVIRRSNQSTEEGIQIAQR